MKRYNLNHLQKLEAESIFVIREVAAQFERPVLLFSGGKDSIVLGHLSRKAFTPAKIPYPFLHIDTGHNFPEVLLFRDAFTKNLDIRLLVGSVQHSIDIGRVKEETGKHASRNYLQSITLLDTIHEQNSMRQSEEDEGTKKNLVPKNDSSLIEMILDNGTQKTNALSFGISIMDENTTVNISAFFH